MRAQRRPLSRRPLRVVGLLVAALVLAGCASPFGDDEPSALASQDRAGRALTQVEAKTALPPEASLPPGWSATPKKLLRPKADDRIKQVRCRSLTRGIDAGWLDAPVRSYANYVNAKGALLGVGIGSHTEEAPALAKVRSTLQKCPQFVSVTPQGQSARVQAQPLELPYLAEDALAYRMIMQTGAGVLVWDLVRVRVGHNSVQGDLITLKGRPQTKPLVTAVKNALLNLS